MMLDLMEPAPLARYGFHSVDALHTMIEAKKLAYADMLRWVGDPRFASAPVDALLSKARAAQRATAIDMQRAAADVQPDRLAGLTTGAGGDTVYLSAIDRDGTSCR
jgi:gamma-glutamyltranspeptidase/glutathione hydrolase